MLEKQFGGNPESRGKFWFPADESAHYRWKWDQINPLSTLCMMEVAGQPLAVCVFLYGFEPLHDAAAVDALQTIMVKWLEQELKGTGVLCRNLRKCCHLLA